MPRLALTLAGLTVTAIMAATAIAAAADEPAEGGKIVKQRCLACHNQEKLLFFAARAPAAERAARWERFLPGHYLPKTDERAAVTAWLKDNAGP